MGRCRSHHEDHGQVRRPGGREERRCAGIPRNGPEWIPIRQAGQRRRSHAGEDRRDEGRPHCQALRRAGQEEQQVHHLRSLRDAGRRPHNGKRQEEGLQFRLHLLAGRHGRYLSEDPSRRSRRPVVGGRQHATWCAVWCSPPNRQRAFCYNKQESSVRTASPPCMGKIFGLLVAAP